MSPVTFLRGHATDSLLPSEEIVKATAAVLGGDHPEYKDENVRHPLTYGTDEGAASVRNTFAEWTNRTLGGSATGDCLNLTNGASYGAASALQQLTSREYTRRAFILSPTYFLINHIFIDAGFEGKMTAIVQNDEGVDIAALEAHLEKDHKHIEGSSKDRYLYRYVLYMVPTFSNPGGETIGVEQRKKLLEIARKYDVLLLCDDVYEWLDYSNVPRPPTLVTLDRETLPADSLGNVVANFSVSKILGGGMRVGWQELATPELARHLSKTGAIVSGGTPAQLNTFIVAELMRTGSIDKIIKRLNEVYLERSETYRAAMQKAFPPGTEIAGGLGGYFFWVTLPKGYDSILITNEAKEQGIILAPGFSFEVFGDRKGWGERCFRVSLSYLPSEEAVPAINTWGKIIAENKTS